MAETAVYLSRPMRYPPSQLPNLLENCRTHLTTLGLDGATLVDPVTLAESDNRWEWVDEVRERTGTPNLTIWDAIRMKHAYASVIVVGEPPPGRIGRGATTDVTWFLTQGTPLYHLWTGKRIVGVTVVDADNWVEYAQLQLES